MPSLSSSNGPADGGGAGERAARWRRRALLGLICGALIAVVVVVIRDRSEIVAKRFVSCLRSHGWTQLTKSNTSLSARSGPFTTSWSQLASSTEPGYATITAYNGSFTVIAVGGSGIVGPANFAQLRERVQTDPSLFVGVLIFGRSQARAETIEFRCLRIAGVPPMP